MKFVETTNAPDPKLIAQTVTTLLVGVIAYLVLELALDVGVPIEVVIAFLLAVLAGLAAGYLMRPAQTEPDPTPKVTP